MGRLTLPLLRCRELEMGMGCPIAVGVDYQHARLHAE
jgi:hypothetical protein